MATRVQIPVALCCIHNFICAHDSEEGVLPGDDHIPDFGESDDDPGDDIQPQVVAADFGEEMHGRGARWDHIAWHIWEQYQWTLQKRDIRN